MSGCVLLVMHGEAREKGQAAVRGQSWPQWGVLFPQIPLPVPQQMKVVLVQGAGGWRHLQASPLPTQHRMGADLLYLALLQGVGWEGLGEDSGSL